MHWTSEEPTENFADMADLLWTDLPFHDWLAGGFLVYSGVVARRDWGQGRPYQAAAWGFMMGLLVAAFFAHLDDWASDRAFVVVLGALVGISTGALASTLAVRAK